MFAAAREAFGRVDAVLNVAGVAGAQALAEITLEEYDRVMNVDLRGVMLGTKHGIKAMLPTGGGAIVNWSSIGGMNGSAMPTSVYSAAKAGVIAFTKAAAIEYGTKGIRANAICPGFIETEMSGGPGAATRFPALVQGSALKRGGQPEEVAELAAFLASDRASFITGAIIPIDGGSTASLPS
jgi:NAD(P)-dependent dehydrogenase (short-subunit alcohol dehydrogenase family)